MKDIAIYGAGGLGKEVACLINAINADNPQWNLIGFFDDGVKKGTPISHYGNVLGNISDLNSWNSSLAIIMSMGSASLIQKITASITNPQVYFPNLIHPNVRFADKETFSIGHGNIIKHDCGFSCDISIGNFNLLNGGVVFGHDVCVGDGNIFMPDVRISGENNIGNGNFFGVGAISLQQMHIGNNVKLGAASVLMRSPKDGELYMGNPAKKVKF